MLLADIRSLCHDAIVTVYETRVDEISLDFPEQFGDIALNCFYLARSLRRKPQDIAAALAAELAKQELVDAAEPVSGYVNLTIARPRLFAETLQPILDAPDSVGQPGEPSGRRILVEFSAPNTNKPQHLGHVRNNCLGDSVARILECAGDEVVRANLINDRGIHICKSMLAYQREGAGATPESSGQKGDHFVGAYYVLFEKRFTEEMRAWQAEDSARSETSKEEFFKLSEWGRAAQAMLQRWEAGDEETVVLWKTMNSWVIGGFEETYANLGIAFDALYLESDTYVLGKEIIERGLADGVFYRRDDGAVEIDLSADKLDKKVVLRSDGTSVYMTQDIGTTVLKTEEHAVQGQIWVVGDEQIYHFRVLFKILERLGYDWAKGLHHLAYGMVNLPEGKMKSREGTVVDADDLIAEVSELARKEISAREPDLGAEELALRARRIGLSALKFMILNVTPQTSMTYDPKASVAFDGDTGPYVLYAYARICRMTETVASEETSFDASKLGDASEIKLVLRLLAFSEVVQKAARDKNPAQIATYLLGLARAYHSHNRAVPILKAEDEGLRGARLALSRATAATLRKGLGLLGIETVDRM